MELHAVRSLDHVDHRSGAGGPSRDAVSLRHSSSHCPDRLHSVETIVVAIVEGLAAYNARVENSVVKT